MALAAAVTLLLDHDLATGGLDDLHVEASSLDFSFIDNCSFLFGGHDRFVLFLNIFQRIKHVLASGDFL